MIISSEQAIDETMAMLKDAWEADPCTAQIPIVWGNVASDAQGESDPFGNPQPYLLMEMLHEGGRKVSLRGGAGSKFEYTGSLMAFLHIQEGKGTLEAFEWLAVAVAAFSGTASPNGVWFRTPHLSDIGPQGTWYVVAMTVTFVYDLTL